jgi:hypothetical protein
MNNFTKKLISLFEIQQQFGLTSSNYGGCAVMCHSALVAILSRSEPSVNIASHSRARVAV